MINFIIFIIALTSCTTMMFLAAFAYDSTRETLFFFLDHKTKWPVVLFFVLWPISIPLVSVLTLFKLLETEDL